MVFQQILDILYPHITQVSIQFMKHYTKCGKNSGIFMSRK